MRPKIMRQEHLTPKNLTPTTLTLETLLALALVGCGGGGDAPVDDPDATAQAWRRTLSVSVNAGGTVTSSPVGITCTSQSDAGCTARFPRTTVVSLSAVPDPGYSFSGWSGACVGLTCSVAMDTSRSVSATFNAIGTPAAEPPPVDPPSATGSSSATGNYATDFAITESPISEGGAWHHTGLDWTSVVTENGNAHGTQTNNTPRYSDSYAYLSGFPANQSAEAVIYLNDDGSSGNKEVELLLRWSDSAHSAQGYEVLLNHRGAYAQIVRWNGPYGDFTYIGWATPPVPKTGDVFSAKIVGNVITAYLNGVQIMQATDSTWATGQPGMGFYVDSGGSNAAFEFSSFTAKGLQ
jgi:hypothetical protein